MASTSSRAISDDERLCAEHWRRWGVFRRQTRGAGSSGKKRIGQRWRRWRAIRLELRLHIASDRRTSRQASPTSTTNGASRNRPCLRSRRTSSYPFLHGNLLRPTIFRRHPARARAGTTCDDAGRHRDGSRPRVHLRCGLDRREINAGDVRTMPEAAEILTAALGRPIRSRRRLSEQGPAVREDTALDAGRFSASVIAPTSLPGARVRRALTKLPDWRRYHARGNRR